MERGHSCSESHKPACDLPLPCVVHFEHFQCPALRPQVAAVPRAPPLLRPLPRLHALPYWCQAAKSSRPTIFLSPRTLQHFLSTHFLAEEADKFLLNDRVLFPAFLHRPQGGLLCCFSCSISQVIGLTCHMCSSCHLLVHLQ